MPKDVEPFGCSSALTGRSPVRKDAGIVSAIDLPHFRLLACHEPGLSVPILRKWSDGRSARHWSNHA
jgi:hypothetical protein